MTNCLEGALKKGFRLWCGLSSITFYRRVYILNKDNSCCGYGQHANVWLAMDHAGEDFVAGHRDRSLTYGEGGCYPPSHPSANYHGELDAWVLARGSCEIFYDRKGRQFVTKLKAREYQMVPEEIKREARAHPGVPQYWTARGFNFQSIGYYPSRIATEVISTNGRGNDLAWDYPVIKTGEGLTMSSSIFNALRAPVVELINVHL